MGDWRDGDVDTGDLWREYRRAQQQRRADRLPKRQAEISSLRVKGFKVRQVTAFQFRIADALDLYPTHRRFHVLKSGKRGTYRSALECAVTHLRGAKE